MSRIQISLVLVIMVLAGCAFKVSLPFIDVEMGRDIAPVDSSQ
jgi:hypothetical protein